MHLYARGREQQPIKAVGKKLVIYPYPHRLRANFAMYYLLDGGDIYKNRGIYPFVVRAVSFVEVILSEISFTLFITSLKANLISSANCICSTAINLIALTELVFSVVPF